jgi:hypothetical protein
MSAFVPRKEICLKVPRQPVCHVVCSAIMAVLGITVAIATSAAAQESYWNTDIGPMRFTKDTDGIIAGYLLSEEGRHRSFFSPMQRIWTAVLSLYGAISIHLVPNTIRAPVRSTVLEQAIGAMRNSSLLARIDSPVS